MPRTPLVYPKIPGGAGAKATQCIAFEKLDGTNLHWVWDRELGWHAFGTRRARYDLDDEGIAAFRQERPGLDAAPDLFRNLLAEPLDAKFRGGAEWGDSVTVFTEFHGRKSFAGEHGDDDPKRLSLIDVETRAGFVPPERFLAEFASFDLPRVVYRGKFTGQFAEDVRRGKFDVNEGVVCKGVSRDGAVWMAKVKTDAYAARLKESFGDRWQDYWE